jgi:hypothetical protein
MRVMRSAVLRAALFVAVLSAPLGGGARGQSEAPGPQPQERPAYKLTGEEGMIQGVITVEGVVPPRPLLPSMDVDPVCAASNRGGARVEDIVAERGRLANALVYVESAALDALAFPQQQQWAPALGGRKCRTVPRVLAMQAGQTLSVRNNDQTTHSYRFGTAVNPVFNKTLGPGEAFEIPYARPEPPFPVRCHQHPWEVGYVAVLPHPFFAVTGRNGSFAIWGLPPGDYEVVVWHEKFKEARMKVSVGAKETKGANFTLKFPADVR